jgi:DNA repair exonuclease SbcCD ATPase subunit
MQDVLSEDIAGTGDGDNTRLVPVAESIRYRKRAQSAEKKLEVLAEQLAQAQTQTAQLSEQLNNAAAEQKLVRQLAAAGAVDLETATLIAKARMQGQSQADVAGVIEQLKKEKQYLFGGGSGGAAPAKTAGARDRLTSNETILERAAKKAATTGSRADLHEYLRLRRNFL